jgi:hypothetical protein
MRVQSTCKNATALRRAVGSDTQVGWLSNARGCRRTRGLLRRIEPRTQDASGNAASERATVSEVPGRLPGPEEGPPGTGSPGHRPALHWQSDRRAARAGVPLAWNLNTDAAAGESNSDSELRLVLMCCESDGASSRCYDYGLRLQFSKREHRGKMRAVRLRRRQPPVLVCCRFRCGPGRARASGRCQWLAGAGPASAARLPL